MEKLPLNPRHSFEEWHEQLTNHSERWKAEEIEAAQELRRAMLSVVLRRMDELNRLSVVLEEQKGQARRPWKKPAWQNLCRKSRLTSPFCSKNTGPG